MKRREPNCWRSHRTAPTKIDSRSSARHSSPENEQPYFSPTARLSHMLFFFVLGREKQYIRRLSSKTRVCALTRQSDRPEMKEERNPLLSSQHKKGSKVKDLRCPDKFVVLGRNSFSITIGYQKQPNCWGERDREKFCEPF